MRLFKDVLAVDTTQHHVVDARHAMFSSCSWHKKPTLVELETESSAIYFGEESICPYDSPIFFMLTFVWCYYLK